MHSDRRTSASLARVAITASAFTLQQAANGYLFRDVAIDLVVVIIVALVMWH